MGEPRVAVVGRAVADPMGKPWRVVQVSGGRVRLLALPGLGTLDAALVTVETWTPLAEEALDHAALQTVHAEATAAWEASPDSSTRGDLNAASIAAGFACPGCGLLPRACAEGDPQGCHGGDEVA